MQRHGHVVHLRVGANVEYEKDTVPMMMTVFGILNVEQEIAKTKILFLIFLLDLTAAMTLFHVRLKNNCTVLFKRIRLLVIKNYKFRIFCNYQ